MSELVFPELKNDLYLRAAKGLPVERTPVWIMRQAGRYLPEFREVRKEADFFKMCQTPELATKVTLQPIDRYPLDAAIIFSDILVILQVLGFDVQMKPEIGPVISNPIKVPEDIDNHKMGDIQNDLQYVYNAEIMTRQKLEGRVPLIGFTGAPWTLFAYCIEGKGSKTFSLSKKFLYLYPEASHKLLKLLTDAIVSHLIGQVVKGHVQALQIFDSWAGVLSKEDFKKFSLKYLREICFRVKSEIGDQIPFTVFAKGANFSIASLAKPYNGYSYDVIGLDWCITAEEAKNQIKLKEENIKHKRERKVTFQGNLDPCILYGSDEKIRENVKKLIESFGKGSNHIANLGHGMNPDHSPEKVAVYVNAVREFSSL